LRATILESLKKYSQYYLVIYGDEGVQDNASSLRYLRTAVTFTEMTNTEKEAEGIGKWLHPGLNSL
jgi:hypothetical protein